MIHQWIDGRNRSGDQQSPSQHDSRPAPVAGHEPYGEAEQDDGYNDREGDGRPILVVMDLEGRCEDCVTRTHFDDPLSLERHRRCS
jgi:hypothetical protein